MLVFHFGMVTNNFTESLNRVMNAKNFSPRPDRRLDSLLECLCHDALLNFESKYIEIDKNQGLNFDSQSLFALFV